MTVSASIVTYKTEHKELENCINILEQNNVDPIFICDNSPTDELKSVCIRFSNVVYVFNNENLGYAAGHNLIIRKSIEMGKKYHLVLNSDVNFKSDVVEKITHYMDENPDVGQVSPKIYYPDGRLQYSIHPLPTPLNLIFRRFLPEKMIERMNYKYCLKFFDYLRPVNAPFHSGCFMFFRNNALDEIGLFDERYFLYAEDIDITRRVHKKYRTMFWPEVNIIHNHRAESYKSLKMLKVHITNMIRYFNKWGWICDKERKEWNASLFKELGYKG